MVFPAISAQNKPVSSHEGLAAKLDIASDFQRIEKEGRTTKNNRLLLTKAEKVWLKAHPVITLGSGMEAPSVFVDDKGNKVGISLDYIHLLGTMLGVEFRIALDTWGSSLNKARKKEIDGILGIFRSPERETYLNFTEPYASSYIAIVMRNTSPKAASYRELAGKRVAAEKGDYIAGYLAANYPDIKLSSDFPDYQSTLYSLVAGDVDAVVGTLPILSLYMDKMFVSDIAVTGLPPETRKNVRIGIRKDWPELAAILDKAVNAVSDLQFRKITRKYISADIGPPLQEIALSDEEKSWIKANPVIEICHQNIPAYSFMMNGVHTGYHVEMMNFMLRLVGLRPNYRILPFHILPDRMRDGRIDVGLDVIYSRERADYMLFSDRSLRITMAIFARNDRRNISDLDALKGKTIASYHGYVMEKKLRTLLPDSSVIHADDFEGMFHLVADGKADLCVQEITSGNYILRKEHINYVESRGILEMPGDLTIRAHNFCVRKDLPILKSILDKADRAVDPAEKQRLWNRWFTSEPDRAIELTPEEQDWLKEHPVIRLASENNWMPIESINEKDEFQGIASDYIRLIQKRLGVTFKTSPVKPWSELLEMVKKRELDLFTAAMETEDRKTYTTFTKPYLSYPMVIITTDKVDYVDGLKGLYGKKPQFQKGMPSPISSSMITRIWISCCLTIYLAP